MMKGRIGKSMIAGEDAERCQVFRILGYKLWYDPWLEFQHHMPESRINWKYIRKLFNSFGRGSNYHELYDELMVKPKGIRAFISQNTILDILNKIRKLLFALPPYIIVTLAGKDEGRKEVLNFEYLYGRLAERIANMGKIRQSRNRLKNAEWRKKFNINK